MRTLFAGLILFCSLTLQAQVGTSVTNGLVGWWLPFGTNASGTDVVDWSGNGNSGTTTNSPYWTNSVTGTTNALNFNGTSQFANIKNVPLNTSNFSVFSWSSAAPALNKFIVSRYDYVGSKRVWGLYQGDAIAGTLCVNVSADGGISNFKKYYTTETVFDGNWHSYGFTFSNSVLLLYVDGVSRPVTKILDGSCSSVFSTTVTNLIGAIGTPASADYYYDGSIADVRFYNRALTQSEITLIYHEGVPWTQMYIGQPMGRFQRLSTTP